MFIVKPPYFVMFCQILVVDCSDFSTIKCYYGLVQ
nr:MAG TPA: hypothetical protein [Bacteriophage sp.]DAN64210.1 MAG TPA: hypothetical protein [Bacteriophage sp.]